MSGCENGAHSMTAEQRKEVEMQVSQQIDLIRNAWENLDADALVSFYSEHSRDTYDGERLSIAGLRKWAVTGYEDIASTRIGNLEDLRIDVLSRYSAVVSWHNRVTEVSVEEYEISEYIALMTQVRVREGGEWRILHNHASTRPLEESN